MNTVELKVEIAKINSIEDLRELNSFVITCLKSKRYSTGNEVKQNLYVGLKVKLKDQHCGRGKSGTLFGKIGEIVKINPTKARVKFDNFRIWNIPYSMLETV